MPHEIYCSILLPYQGWTTLWKVSESCRKILQHCANHIKVTKQWFVPWLHGIILEAAPIFPGAKLHSGIVNIAATSGIVPHGLAMKSSSTLEDLGGHQKVSEEEGVWHSGVGIRPKAWGDLWGMGKDLWKPKEQEGGPESMLGLQGPFPPEALQAYLTCKFV